MEELAVCVQVHEPFWTVKDAAKYLLDTYHCLKAGRIAPRMVHGAPLDASQRLGRLERLLARGATLTPRQQVELAFVLLIWGDGVVTDSGMVAVSGKFEATSM